MRKTTTLILGLVSVAGAGCTGEMAAKENLDDDQSAVAGGGAWTGSGIGTVEFGLCTGVEIGPGCILTAAHCMPATQYRNNAGQQHLAMRGLSLWNVWSPNNIISWPEWRAMNDLAVIYTGNMSAPGWHPRDLVAPQVGDAVTAVGMGGNTAPALSSGPFEIKSITYGQGLSGFFSGVQVEPLGDPYITYGDSGGPILKHDKVAGICSTASGPQVDITGGAYYAGMTSGATQWIKQTQADICRKIGTVSVSIVSNSAPQYYVNGTGWNIQLTSTDPVGTFGRIINLWDQGSSGLNYVELTAYVRAPANWSFVRWEAAANERCPCAGQGQKCTASAASLTDFEERTIGRCHAVFKYTPPTTPPPCQGASCSTW